MIKIRIITQLKEQIKKEIVQYWYVMVIMKKLVKNKKNNYKIQIKI